MAAAAGCGPAPWERRVRWLREVRSTLRGGGGSAPGSCCASSARETGRGPARAGGQGGAGQRAAGLAGPRGRAAPDGRAGRVVPRGGGPWLQGWATEKEGGRAAGWGDCEGGGEGRGVPASEVRGQLCVEGAGRQELRAQVQALAGKEGGWEETPGSICIEGDGEPSARPPPGRGGTGPQEARASGQWSATPARHVTQAARAGHPAPFLLGQLTPPACTPAPAPHPPLDWPGLWPHTPGA